jgi:hypothetical protein
MMVLPRSTPLVGSILIKVSFLFEQARDLLDFLSWEKLRKDRMGPWATDSWGDCITLICYLAGLTLMVFPFIDSTSR